MFQAIFFDLDQTLIDRTATFMCYLQQAHEDLFPAETGVAFDAFVRAVMRWDDNGYRAKPDTFGRALREVNQPERLPDVLAHFETHYGHQAALIPGAEETLKTLSERWPLALVSNGRVDGQQNKLAVTGIAGYFEQVLISEGEGLKKPEPEIYLRACERLKVAPEQVLFVGDHPTNDVTAPMSLGMQAVWVRNDAYAAPSDCWATVQSVAELPALL